MTSRPARSLWIVIHLGAALALSALILALLSLSELEPGEHPLIGLIAILMMTSWLAIVAAAAGLIVLPVLALLAWALVDRVVSPIA